MRRKRASGIRRLSAVLILIAAGTLPLSGIASASATPGPSAPSAAASPGSGESAKKGGACAVTSSRHLTGVNDGQSQLYTVYLDIKSNQQFTSSQVITATRARKA